LGQREGRELAEHVGESMIRVDKERIQLADALRKSDAQRDELQRMLTACEEEKDFASDLEHDLNCSTTAEDCGRPRAGAGGGVAQHSEVGCDVFVNRGY
jgi:hypothetical protein